MFDNEKWNSIEKEVHEIVTSKLNAVEREQYESLSKFVTMYNNEQTLLKLRLQDYLKEIETKKLVD